MSTQVLFEEYALFEFEMRGLNFNGALASSKENKSA
jgi:hypothetical protein